ncbi:MAG: hypothetical protein M1817_002332 [Caeruleum heppii]|nr:MAG: hypothetical protein M1817_003483 [Caeruleum heppii]KAI9673694.1 MAG: hypothetical protein M1817_002332 [Caeruleum heppii]
MPLNNARAIYPAVNPEFVSFPSRRSVVHSTNGMVACTQPLAAQAGVKILHQGGNAADAAVAVAAALNMTEPASTGIGGDMFCLFYSANTKKIRALNGSGRSASNATLEQIRRDLKIPDGKNGSIPMDSVHSVTVPGAAAGWTDVVEKLGSGKVSLQEVLMPAIELGEEGFPVSELASSFWRADEQMLRDASPNYGELLKSDPNAPNGNRAPRPGDLFTNPNLARTFRELAKHGRKGFYEGRIASEMVKVTQDLGGHLTLDDLKHHGDLGSEEVTPISIKFNGQNISDVQKPFVEDSKGDNHGVEVWECPPNGQGIVALIALGILEELEKNGKVKKFTREDHNSTEYLHTIIECLRIAFSDARWWVCDPSTSPLDPTALLNSSYLSSRAALFSATTAMPPPTHGSPAHNHTDTVYFAVTDAAGNGCSFINSNFGGFGSGIVPRGCGFPLHSRGASFSLDPTANHPNVLAGRKRPYHTIIPALLTNPSDGGSLHSVLGVMGGFMQPQGQVQILLNMLVFGHTPQTALDAPRFCIGAGMPGQGDVVESTVFLEEGIEEAVAEGLRGMGHRVEIVRGWQRGLFGRGQIIRCHTEGGRVVYSAGSDPRGDGGAFPA